MNNAPIPSVKTIRLRAALPHDVQRAASLLMHGKIVALPTETVYGLAANGLDVDAIRAVFAAKQRPASNPLILHTHDAAHAASLLDLSSPLTRQRFNLLAAAFWPGPLTIIAHKAPHVPLLATANLETAAVRVPSNESTRVILQKINFPLVMPSANLSTRPSPTCAEHVLATLDGRIDAVLDDGACAVGIESTVVKIDEQRVRVLRPGVIDADALRACLNEAVNEITVHHEITSPGQSTLHYSPLIASVMTCTVDDVDTLWHTAHSFLIRQKDFLRLVERCGARASSTTNLLLSDDVNDYARELYHALYAAEQNPHSTLVVVMPKNDETAWSAVIDRLKRTER